MELESVMQNDGKRIPKSVDLFQTLIEKIEEGITFSDAHGHFEIFNSKMQEITGYTIDEANRSGDFMTLLYPDPLEKKKALDGLYDTTKKGVSGDIETTIQTKDSKKKTLLVSTSMIRYNNRDTFISIYHDITMRKEMEALIQESEKKFRMLFENLPEGLFLVDESHNMVEVNPALLRLTGYSREEMIGKTCHNFVCPRMKGSCPIFDKSGEVANLETVLLTNNRGEVPILKTCTKYSVGEKTFVLESIRDISDMKKAEKELKVRSEALAVANVHAAELVEELKTSQVELQKKVSELERFKRITIGRELKMIELKKRVEELERKIKL